jgi:hypothetical protein
MKSDYEISPRDEQNQNDHADQHHKTKAEDKREFAVSFTDGMNLEDWLVKHREQERSSMHDEACTAIGDNEPGINKIAAHLDTVPTPIISTSNPASKTTLQHHHGGSQILCASVRYQVESEDDIFSAELPPSKGCSPKDDRIIIEGTIAPRWSRQQRLYVVVGCSVLVCGVAIALAITLTSIHLSSSDNTATFSPTGAPTGGDLNWTIADSIYYVHNQGAQSLVNLESGLLFLQTLNRTDMSFTEFGTSQKASFLNGIDTSLVSKLIVPEWNGQVVRT